MAQTTQNNPREDVDTVVVASYSRTLAALTEENTFNKVITIIKQVSVQEIVYDIVMYVKVVA